MYPGHKNSIGKLSLALLPIVVALLLGALYRGGLNGPFLLDDMGSTNALRTTAFSWSDIYYDLTHNDSGVLGRPVSVLSLLFSKLLHGAGSWGFKYHNLILHCATGLLLFCFLLKLVPRLDQKLGQRRVALVAAFTTLLWLFHPLMVSTVLYAVQRMAQLSAFFSIAALLAYLGLRDCLNAASNAAVLLRLLVFLAMTAMAVLSKENGALVLCYVAMLEVVLPQRFQSSTVAMRRYTSILVLFVVLPMLSGAAYLLANADRYFDYSFRDFTLYERLLTQLRVLLFYVKLVLLPSISEMSLFHDGWQPVRSLDLVTLLLGLLWLGLLSSVLLLRNRAAVFAFGIGWYVVSHLMESTVFALELVFEHRNYLAAAGLLLIPVYWLCRYWQERTVTGLVLVFLMLFSFMTKARVSEWSSEDMIYSIAVRDHPDSVRARIPYAGVEYNRGNLEEAIRHLQAAAEVDERSTSAIVVNMLFLCGRGRDEEMNALIDEGTRRAALYPATPQSISSMDLIHAQIQQGRCKELVSPRILEWLQAAREQESNRNNRMFTGYIQRQQGFYHYVLGDRAGGLALMTEAFENTGMASILGEIIDVEIRLGALDNARSLLERLKQVNEERFGAESALFDQRKAQFDAALKRAQQQAAQVPVSAETQGQ